MYTYASSAPAPALAFSQSAVMQPAGGPLTAAGFISPSYNPMTVGGNIANSAAAFQSPSVTGLPWTPSYGLQARWNEAPQRNVPDPLCRMLAYPAQCSVAKALSNVAYPSVETGVSAYPYAGNAAVQLTDASPARLGNPGFFLPVSDFGEEAARAAGHPSTHVYGNVTSYANFMTDPKDGPAYGQTCATRYICGTPNPSMVGYESSSADPTNLTCPASYLKTVEDPTLVTLPATAMAVALANYPDPSPNAFFNYAYPPRSHQQQMPPSRRLAKLVNENVLEPVQFIVDGTLSHVVGVSSAAYVPEPSHTVGAARISNNETATISVHASLPASTHTLGLRFENRPSGDAYIASRVHSTPSLAQVDVGAGPTACPNSCYTSDALSSNGLTCSGAPAASTALPPCQPGSCRLNEVADGVCYEISTIAGKGVTCQASDTPSVPTAMPGPVQAKAQAQIQAVQACTNTGCADACLSKFGACSLPQCPNLKNVKVRQPNGDMVDASCDYYCSTYAKDIGRECCISACNCCNT